jgi:hypothetical protein
MARYHRHRFRIPAAYGSDFDGLPLRGWVIIAAAVMVAVSIVRAAM